MSELSGFEVLVLAKEIDSALRGTYVNNIYTIGASQLVRFRRPGGDDAWLVVSPKKGAWISARVSEREETGDFTSRLRGELERARFASCSQAGLDRVFLLDFEGTEDRRLVIELMPPGNLIVTDASGKIRLVLNEMRSDARRLVKGAVYAPPKQSRLSPDEVGPEEIRRMLAEESTLGKAIGRHVALPKKYVAVALERLGATDSTPSKVMSGREGEIVQVLRSMVEATRSAPAPCICETPGGDELFAFRPAGMTVKEESGSMSQLCDALMLEDAVAPTPREDPEDAKRRELEATVANLRSEAEELLAKASKARESAKTARTLPLPEALLAVKEAGIKSSRDPASPAGAASLLYDFAKEMETKSELSVRSAEKLERRASRARPGGGVRTTPISRRKGEWFEKFRWFFTGEGRLAIGGRDAQTNSTLLRKHLDSNDTVYHADVFGSPFFILKGGVAQTEEEVREVAQATVGFSSAWKTGLGSADAYWVSPGQVSPAAPSGEYLARGSYSIRGKKNFVQKMIVELAVGVDHDGRVTAGPEAAVKRSCDHYVVLVPHNEKASETAKRVLKDISGGARPVTLDEIQRALPAGGGKVVRSV